jgi:hypothetical protein
MASSTASCRGCRPGWSTAIAPHGPYAPERGHRYNPHKLLLDPWAREIVGRFRWDDLQHRPCAGASGGRALLRCPRQRRARAEGAVAAPLPRCWGSGRALPAERRPLRAAREGFHDADAGYAGAAARPHRRRSRTRGDRALPPPRRDHAVACCRCTTPSASAPERRPDSATTGATTRWASSARSPAAATTGESADRRASRRRRCAARGRLRGDPRRGLQPHRRGRRTRADAELPRTRQRQLVSPACGRPRRYVNWSGCGNTLNLRTRGRTVRAGLTALLDQELGRRRLPLRSRQRARPHPHRLRSGRGPSSSPCAGSAAGARAC